MKRSLKIILFCLAASATLLFFGCVSDSTESTTPYVKKTDKDFIILCSKEKRDRECASLILDQLSEEGFSGDLLEGTDYSTFQNEGFGAVITVGREATDSFLSLDSTTPCLYCITDAMHYTPKRSAIGLDPVLSPKSMVKAADTLLPKESSVLLVSDQRGASDMQDACDLLDSAGRNYKVELLDGRTYSEAVKNAHSEGFGIIILPRAPGEDLSDHMTVSQGFGGGEGCTALQFCPDMEKLALEICELFAKLDCGLLSEDMVPEWNDGFFCLYIKEHAREKMSESAVGIVAESYNIVVLP